MFNKLIIAVLTLGLLLTFCSAAISSDVPKVGVNRVETSNPNAPKLNLATPIERPVSGNQKPLNALNPVQTPARVLPPPYVCEYYDYSGGAMAYFWKLTDRYGDSIQGMRFTPRAGYNCTLLTAYVGLYGSAFKGNPGMRVTLFDDDGFGMPGAVKGYVDVPAGDLSHSGAYYQAVDISTLNAGAPFVYSNAAEFHIGVSKLGVDGDTLAMLSDDGSAGQLRSWEYWYDAYGTMNGDWGIDVNFLLGVDVCCGKIPYTSCYTQQYNCGVAYYWRQPDAYGDDYFNMRFSTVGPETLKAVGLVTYRPGSKPWGNPDLAVFVWPDDGAGFPDLAATPIYADTLPWASLVHYPSWNIIDLSALNIVVSGEFHLGWSTVATGPNDTLATLSDDGSCGTGRSSEYWGAWGLMLDDWGVDVNFLMYADLCKDEFSDCRTLSDFDGDAYYWRYPDRYGDISMHQLFVPKGEGCRLEKVSVRFYWKLAMAGWPLYSTNSILQVNYKDGLNYNLPGALAYSKTIYPADYSAIPPTTASTRWWATFDVAADNFLFDQDIWVGVESQALDTLSGFFTLSDDGTTGGYRSAEGWGGAYGYMLDDWGVDVDHGVMIDVCCVPIAECVCAPGEDWPAMGKNYARTDHSGNSLGTAQCQWTKAWQYTGGQTMVYNNPVIYQDTVIGYFFDRIVALDVNTGAQIWERLSDAFVIGSGYPTPSVENGMIYTAGGSTHAFSALRVSDGTTVWTRDYTVNVNFVTFGPNVLLDVAGTRVVFYADDGGNIYAADALTGADYPGWPAYVPLGSAVNRGLTTDGNLIFVGTDMPTLAISGDIYALNPADGSIVWQLSVPPAGGYYGPIVVPPKDFGGAEGFTAGISVANVCGPGNLSDNVLYTASYYNIADYTSPVQDGGVLYSINAADGSVNWAALCQQANYNIPAIDAARVIYQDWTPWLNAGNYRGPVGFGRASGNVDWVNTTTNPGWGDGAMMEGLLSCEPEGASDIYAGIYKSNFVNFYLADNGLQKFHRRFTGYLNGVFSKAGHRIAPAMDDGHLLLPWRNKIVCLAPTGVDRPRLELPHYVMDVPVPFDSGNPSRITFDDAIRNSGCADLTIDSVIFDEVTNHTEPGLYAALNTVNEDRLDRLNQQTEIFNPKTQQRWLSFRDENFRITDEMTGKSISSTEAAFAPPSFIIGLVSPLPGATVAADVTIPIVVDVDGDAITRGYHPFYARIYSDDPDYFLDSARIDKDLPIHGGKYAVPQIQMGLIGGCLYASRILTFGAGGANSEKIWNSGMLGNADTSSNFVVSGNSGTDFAGGLIFVKSKYRLATHIGNWHSDPTQWKSLLADPNCVDQSCDPQISSPVLLGKISTDNGASYADVFGNVISVAFVDSVQNMDDDTSAAMHWDWSYPRDYGLDPPYDDTLTIGFHSCTQYIGALNVPALANFTIHRHAVTSRNSVPITDLYLTAIMDWDVSPSLATNVAGYDAAHSLSYFYDCGAKTSGWGFVKIPFGCGYSPLICSQTNSSGQSIFNDTDLWLDSLYRWASTRTGLWHQTGTAPCLADPTDRNQFINLQKSTVPATDTAVYAYAFFGLTGITNADQASAYFGIANIANQFCGFGRGDVNNDGAINLADIIALAWYVADPVNHPGPYPFRHLGDVNNDGVITDLDVTYMINFYFNFGACPVNGWVF